MSNDTIITCTIDGHEITGTIDVIATLIGSRATKADTATKPEKQPKPEPAQKKQPKAKKPAPAPKADSAASEPDPWYLGIVTAPWVKKYVCGPNSTIVKVTPEPGHGTELRTAGFRPMRGNHEWWAPKDEGKARAKGERYLANKAARDAAKVA